MEIIELQLYLFNANDTSIAENFIRISIKLLKSRYSNFDTECFNLIIFIRVPIQFIIIVNKSCLIGLLRH